MTLNVQTDSVEILFLHSERIDFYKYMAESLIVNERHPLLIVDWSPVNGSEIFQLLRVSIPMGGRALTIYEKTYEESELNTRAAHQELLNAIKYCLPEGCRPIILADAIFKPLGLKQLKIWGGTGYVESEETFNYQLMAKTGNGVVNGLHLLTAKQPV